ncbi:MULTISPECIES: hypothetical protein [unclassified Mesorhizobium]|uniref:hypothetical protein n=1 Tax=unclassified Mesorhizobium TaxID=325217 RepID=UPI000B205351|nr:MULTISPECIES: hypothetical protein [unclassified Mesorhizobium]
MILASCRVLLLVLLFPATAGAADLIRFWDTPQHGGNSFNRLPPDKAYSDALRGYGAGWVRLSYDKWKPERRDFLRGDADHYDGLAAKDLATLKTVLDRADAAGLKVVIAPLSLPGMRWAQNNGDKFDGRLWQDKAFGKRPPRSGGISPPLSRIIRQPPPTISSMSRRPRKTTA